MGTLKTNEEIKKEISETMEELSWVVESGDAHDLQDACDKAHTCLAYTLALIERLENDASFYKNINALMDKTNGEALSLIDSLIESNLERAEKIEQLKAQNANLNEVAKRIQDSVDQWELVADTAGAVEDMARENTELRENIMWMEVERDDLKRYIRQLEAERDAVMKDMNKNCISCKHAGCNNPGSDGCPYVEQCQNYAKWQWRGVQKEE